MVFKLKNIVPLGRSLKEYYKMFSLNDRDLQLSIIDCGSGPSSFNAEMNELGNKVISVDPLYQFTTQEIESRILETYSIILEGLEKSRNRFVWQYFDNPKDAVDQRLSSMKLFLADLERGLKEQRYLIQELPYFSFESQQFDLALCGHLLFTYSETLSDEFHLAAIKEMCRVAKEVRIFPLLENFTGETSRHLQPIQKELQNSGYRVEIIKVDYEFQKNGDRMLVVTHSR